MESVREGPVPSASTQKPHMEDSASMDKNQLNKILRFVQKRRDWRGAHKPTATTLTSLDMTDGHMDKIYDLMTCQGCGTIPHPVRRYICSRGHFYCWQCFKKREELAKLDNEPQPICGHAMNSEKLQTVGYSHGCLSPKTDFTDFDKQRMEREKEEGTCLLAIQRMEGADPLYYQLFGNTNWQCPYVLKKNDVGGCTSDGVPGWDIHKHIKKCCETFLSQK